MSTEEQAKLGFSLGGQLQACREKAEALGATEVLEFSDDGAPGDLLDRPGLTGLRELVRSRAVAGVVVYDPDRLARNLGHQLLITEEMEKHGVRLEFVNFAWQDTPEGKLFYSIRGAIAEYEKAKIRERSAFGIQRKMREGKLAFHARPYGYRFDAQRDELMVDEEQARWVREIFRWVVEEDLGPQTIANRLNELGVPSPRRKGWWYKQAVAKLLRNPVYAGTFYQNKTDQAGMRKNRFLPKEARVKRRYKPKEAWIPVPVPAIVPREIWDRAQAILDRGKRRRPGSASTGFLLSGLAVCGRCGHHMHGASGKARQNGMRPRYYACYQRHPSMKYLNPRLHSHERCPMPYVRAERLEEEIWNKVWGWILSPAALARAVEAQWDRAARERLEAELATVREAKNRAAAARSRLLDLVASGAASAEEVEPRLRFLQDQITRLDRQEVELRKRLVAAGDPITVTAAVERIREELLASGPGLSLEERQHVLRLLAERVVLYPDGRWRIEFRAD